jgi:hypothetical protein
MRKHGSPGHGRIKIEKAEVGIAHRHCARAIHATPVIIDPIPDD